MLCHIGLFELGNARCAAAKEMLAFRLWLVVRTVWAPRLWPETAPLKLLQSIAKMRRMAVYRYLTTCIIIRCRPLRNAYK